MRSEQINELAKALAAAQGEIESAAKGAENKFGGYKYADLASIWAACRAPLSKNGICIVQTTEIEGDSVTLLTEMLHSSGQWVSGKMPVRVLPVYDKETKQTKATTPQAFGSAITYARKYSLMAIVGISSEDDDGEEAAKSARQSNERQYAPRKPASSGFKIQPNEGASSKPASLDAGEGGATPPPSHDADGVIADAPSGSDRWLQQAIVEVKLLGKGALKNWSAANAGHIETLSDEQKAELRAALKAVKETPDPQNPLAGG